jgi:hypothetical protein
MIRLPDPLTEDALRSLMQQPAYWRDRDPELHAAIAEGFRRLYSGGRDAGRAEAPAASARQESAEAMSAQPHTMEKARAGRSANLLEMGRPEQAPDIVVGHLSPGEIVVPPSAQTPEAIAALRAALGEDLPAYTVGSGRERRNPVSGLVAFADTWSVPGYQVRGDGPNRGGQMGLRQGRVGGNANISELEEWAERQLEAIREYNARRGLTPVLEDHMRKHTEEPLGHRQMRFHPHANRFPTDIYRTQELHRGADDTKSSSSGGWPQNPKRARDKFPNYDN